MHSKNTNNILVFHVQEGLETVFVSVAVKSEIFHIFKNKSHNNANQTFISESAN